MSNRTNGSVVRRFEEVFARYVGARYAIAMMNGTCTLHTALVALDLCGDADVLVPPLTMASTTLAVLHAQQAAEQWGLHYGDIGSDTWVMHPSADQLARFDAVIPVSLYGVAPPLSGENVIDDAAQTLRKHSGCAFTSYSFQASKILSAGEGGMLVTDDRRLAKIACEFRDLGYRYDEPGQESNWLKHPAAIRHYRIGYNYRMSDIQAQILLAQLPYADGKLAQRRYSAECYSQAIQGVDWITPQYVPAGWPHSWWTYAIALRDRDLWEPLAQAITSAGGERPYAAWRITYTEPAFRHLAPDGTCPVAEDLQPRLMQLQTNHEKAGAERAAEILHRAIRSLAF